MSNKRENSFEFLGYDFLIDEDFRVWLIEVNSNPYLGVPNDYIRNVLPKMMDDMFRIVLDPVFPDSDREGSATENLFDLIYSPGNTNNSTAPVNKRRSFDLSHLYPIPELQDKTITQRINTVKEFNKNRLIKMLSLNLMINKGKDGLMSTHYSSFRASSNSFTPVKTLTNSKSKPKFDMNSKKNSIEMANESQSKYSLNMNQAKNEIIRSNSSQVNYKENLLSSNNRSFVNNDQKEKQKKLINQNLESQVDDVIKISEYTYQRKLSDELFDKIYGRLIQWEIFDEKQLNNALNALSKMYTLNLLTFTEPKVPSKLAKILRSSNCPENIRAGVLKILISIIKNKTMRKYLLTKQVVESLISFMLDYKQVSDSLSDTQKQCVIDCCECLCLLSYQERLKIYIPGDNIYNMRKRMTASEFGIVICLQQFEEDFKSLTELTNCIRGIIDVLDIGDVEAQIKIVKHLKSLQNAKHNAISEKDDEEEENEEVDESMMIDCQIIDPLTGVKTELRHKTLGSLKEIHQNQYGSQREELDIENIQISDLIISNLDLKQIKAKLDAQLVKLYQQEKLKREKEVTNKEINRRVLGDTLDKAEQDRLFRIELQRKAELAERQRREFKALPRQHNFINKNIDNMKEKSKHISKSSSKNTSNKFRKYSKHRSIHESDADEGVCLPDINQNHDAKMRHFSPFQRSSAKSISMIKEGAKFNIERVIICLILSSIQNNKQQVIHEVFDAKNEDENISHRYSVVNDDQNNENDLIEEREQNNISQKLPLKDSEEQELIALESKSNNPFHNSTKRFKNVMKKQLVGNPYLEFVTSQMVKNLSNNPSVANKNLMKIYGITKTKTSQKKKQREKQKLERDDMLFNENQ